MPIGQRDLNETSRAPWAIPVVVTIVAIAAGIYRLTSHDPEEAAPPPVESASASLPPGAPPAPRCTEVSAEPFVIGDLPPPKPAPAEPPPGADPTADPAEPAEDPSAPFAVEIGRGAVFEGGFAAGARREAEGGAVAVGGTGGAAGAGGRVGRRGRARRGPEGAAVAMVPTVGADGTGGKLVRLGRSRGDLDAPVVAGAGASVLA